MSTTTSTSTVKRAPITARHRALLNAPTINSQFPISFSNGNSLSEWSGSCAQCGKIIVPHFLHGVVTQPLDTVVAVEAVGLCAPCNLVTPFSCRVRDDLSLESVVRGIWIRSDHSGTRPLATIEDNSRPSSLLKGMAMSWGLFLMLMLPMIVGLFTFGRG